MFILCLNLNNLLLCINPIKLLWFNCPRLFRTVVICRYAKCYCIAWCQRGAIRTDIFMTSHGFTLSTTASVGCMRGPGQTTDVWLDWRSYQAVSEIKADESSETGPERYRCQPWNQNNKLMDELKLCTALGNWMVCSYSSTGSSYTIHAAHIHLNLHLNGQNKTDS